MLGREFDGAAQRLLPFRPRSLFRRFARHLHAGFARQLLDRLRKLQALGAHDEADHIAMGAAAEAVEEPLVLADRERRGLFIVERAEAGCFAAALANEPHPAPDHIADRDPRAQILQKPWREGHPLTAP